MPSHKQRSNPVFFNTYFLTREIKWWFGIIFKANLAQQWLKRHINQSSDHKITKVQLDQHQIRLQMFESVVYCYLYHVRFHHPQRTNAVLSCIFISHCCDFEISNASKYDILKCLQVFHFAWQPACTSMVLCSCEVTSGEPPASQEECGLKENLSLPVYFSLSLFVPLRWNNCFCEVTSSSLVLLKVLHLCHNVATRCVESVPLMLRQWQACLHILCCYYWGPLWSVNVVGCWLLDQW